MEREFFFKLLISLMIQELHVISNKTGIFIVLIYRNFLMPNKSSQKIHPDIHLGYTGKKHAKLLQWVLLMDYINKIYTKWSQYLK